MTLPNGTLGTVIYDHGGGDEYLEDRRPARVVHSVGPWGDRIAGVLVQVDAVAPDGTTFTPNIIGERIWYYKTRRGEWVGSETVELHHRRLRTPKFIPGTQQYHRPVF